MGSEPSRLGDVMPGTLQRKLSKGEFVVTTEIGPPRSADPEDFMKRARAVKGCADAYNITDNQTATVRMSSLSGCVLCLSEGMEPIMQVTCRDRNRLAVQSDVLGATALGVRNVLCLSGDHQSFGDQPGAKNVYDLDSTQQLMVLEKMRARGELWGGEKLPYAPDLFLGAVANPFGEPAEMHMIRLSNKVTAGARFIQTQAIFDIDAFEKWLEHTEKEGITKEASIIAGIIPLKSYNAAKHIADGVPGTFVPDEVLERMSSAADESAEGMKIAKETIEAVREMDNVSGVHIMPIFWYSSVRPLLEATGLIDMEK